MFCFRVEEASNFQLYSAQKTETIIANEKLKKKEFSLFAQNLSKFLVTYPNHYLGEY